MGTQIKVLPINTTTKEVNGKPQIWSEEHFKKMEKVFGKKLAFRVATEADEARQIQLLSPKEPVSTIDALPKEEIIKANKRAVKKQTNKNQ